MEEQLGRKVEVAVLLLGFLWSLGAYAIVGPIPTPIPPDHPGSYNAVSLVKPWNDGKFRIFCSAFIFNETTIVTAKHCVADRAPSEMRVYLGPDTNNVDPKLIMEIEDKDVYGTNDWKNYFPAFDVAVVKLASKIPGYGDKSAEPYFDTVPFLTDPSMLESAETFHLVGYGNQSPKINVIIAGEKKHVPTGLLRFVDTPQLSSLIVFQGELGHSNCHGDSGGPAYAYLAHPITGEKAWYVVGTAAGFDLALTPDSYQALDDEIFPFIAKCDQSQTIYSYIGDYYNWIRDLAGAEGTRLGETRELAPGQFELEDSSEKDFQWYCENVTWNDSRWGAVRDLMIIATDTTKTHSPDDVFANCELASEVLKELKEVKLDDHSFVDDLEPLSSLPNLETLSVESIELPNLTRLNSKSLQRLRLKGIKNLKTLKFLEQFPSAENLTELRVIDSNLESLSGLEKLKKLEHLNLKTNQILEAPELSRLGQLETLDVSDNQLKDLRSLENLARLKELLAFNNQLSDLPGLATLETLHISHNQFQNIEFLKASSSLRDLQMAANHVQDLSPLSGLAKLRKLDVSRNPLPSVGLKGDWLSSVEILKLNGLALDDLGFLSSSNKLRKLYASGTQVSSLKPLMQLQGLTSLFVGNTPVSKMNTANESLCPTEGPSPAVSRFCQRF